MPLEPRVKLIHIDPPEHALLAFMTSDGFIRRVLAAQGSSKKAVAEYMRRLKWKDRMLKLFALYPQVMEFITVKVLFINIPTYVAMQLVRHRHISWMVESRRHSEPPEEPADVEKLGVDKEVAKKAYKFYKKAVKLYKKMVKKGVHPQHARLVLTQVDPRIVYACGNLRAFTEMICKRLFLNSQQETKKVVQMLVEEIDKHIPGYKDKLETLCKHMSPCMFSSP